MAVDTDNRGRVVRTFAEFAHFHGVGAAGAVVNLSALYAVHDLAGLAIYPSLVVSFSIAVAFNFTAIKAWTFRDVHWALGHTVRQFARFYCIAVAGLGLNIAVFYGLNGKLGAGVYWAQSIAIAAAAPFHFFLNRRFTFRRSRRAKGAEAR